MSSFKAAPKATENQTSRRYERTGKEEDGGLPLSRRKTQTSPRYGETECSVSLKIMKTGKIAAQKGSSKPKICPRGGGRRRGGKPMLKERSRVEKTAGKASRREENSCAPPRGHFLIDRPETTRGNK